MLASVGDWFVIVASVDTGLVSWAGLAASIRIGHMGETKRGCCDKGDNGGGARGSALEWST